MIWPDFSSVISSSPCSFMKYVAFLGAISSKASFSSRRRVNFPASKVYKTSAEPLSLFLFNTCGREFSFRFILSIVAIVSVMKYSISMS